MPSTSIEFADLSPMAQACWDRDGVAAWAEQLAARDCVFKLHLDPDGIPTVVGGSLIPDVAWWEYVETPEPRWRSSDQAYREGYRGIGFRDIR